MTMMRASSPVVTREPHQGMELARCRNGARPIRTGGPWPAERVSWVIGAGDIRLWREPGHAAIVALGARGHAARSRRQRPA